MSIFINEIKKTLEEVKKELKISSPIIVENSNGNNNGDFSTNLAMISAKELGDKPQNIAQKIISLINNGDLFEKIEIAGPGFINFTIKNTFVFKILNEILSKKNDYGKGKKKNFKYDLELVSANPTGFLHVGHARNGAIGSTVANLLKFSGYDVIIDYYTNDKGNQINILAVTLFYHYLKNLNVNVDSPEEMYGGDIYSDVSKQFIEKYNNKFIELRFENNKITDEKVHDIFREEGIEIFLELIKEQMTAMGVYIDHFSSEKLMYDNNEIDKMLVLYKELNVTYMHDGALFLKTTDLGDDKDRVLVKNNGDYTYITPDLASHNVRIKRSKADKYVNFWGGDHHGYVPRMRAGLALLGHSPEILDIDVIQMVRLIKDGQEFKMSKRKGTAIWLVDLLEMVGKDALRYMLISKNPSSHMDFDLSVATEKNSSNPVYYAQYATARCNKLIRKAEEIKLDLNVSDFNLLVEEKEKQLMILMDSFNKVVETAALNRMPSGLCDFIQSLAKMFHSYYSDTLIFDEVNLELTKQRICLVKSVYQVLSNAFAIIDIEVKNEM